MNGKHPSFAIAVVLLVTSALGIWYWRGEKGSHGESRGEAIERRSAGPSPVQAKPGLLIQPRDAYQRVYEEVTALKYEFLLTNAGRKPVRILRVQPDCLCNVVQLSSSELEPGESTTFSVLYQAISIMGELPKRRILVQTDDPDCPIVKCSVGGFRERRFVVDPPSIDFGIVVSRSASSRKVVIEAKGKDMCLAPEKVVCTNPWIEADVVWQGPLPEGGTKLVLNVSLSDETPVGTIDGQVFIPRVEDDGVGPRIPVRAEVSGSVRLVPPNAFMGIMKTDAIVERTVEVLPLVSSYDLFATPRLARVVEFGESPRGIHLATVHQEPSVVRVTAVACELGPGRFEHQVPIKCELDGTPCEVLLRVTGMVSP